jgi:allantoinase
MTTLNVTSDLGRTPAKPGLDHSYYDFVPAPRREVTELPGGATVALGVVVDLAAVEWERDGKPLVPPPGGRGWAPYPDYARISHREYGHRTGVFRLVRLLKEFGITPAVAIDVATAEHYRPLVDALLPEVGEVIAHGLSATRPITSRMTEDEERHYVQSTLDRLEAALGQRPAGWLGAQTSESDRTPQILTEAGVGYTLDWAHDEVPTAMAGTGSEPLWTFPLSHELSDLNAWSRNLSPADYGGSLIDALSTLRGVPGTTFGLHLHPWISGQPFRTRALRRALEAWGSLDDVWIAAPGAIVDHYRARVTAT